MFDITEHKWSDKQVGYIFHHGTTLAVGRSGVDFYYINRDDSIAIAKHFYDRMTDKEQIDFFYTMNDDAERLDISKSDLCSKHMEPCDCLGVIPHSQTYKSLNLDSVAEIKDNELFNKEDDLHG